MGYRAGVHFVLIYHNNWVLHDNVAGRLPSQCKDVDQACHRLDQRLTGVEEATVVKELLVKGRKSAPSGQAAIRTRGGALAPEL